MTKITQQMPVILLIAGAALVALGIGFLCPPVGVIATGAELIAFGVLMLKAGGDADD